MAGSGILFSFVTAESWVGGRENNFSRPEGLKRSHCSPYATSPCSNLRFHSGVFCDKLFFLGEELKDFF